MSNPERTLNNNKVSTFLIRIDLDESSNLNYGEISEELLRLFPDRQIQIYPHYNINLDTKKIEKVEVNKYIYQIDNGVVLEVSPVDKSIIFSSTYYTTNDLYKERLEKIVSVFNKFTGGMLMSRRIGMRYINTFQSFKEGNLPNVLNNAETKILKEKKKKKSDLSRLIVVDEYLKEDYRIRVQYGIPNKFYPGKISSKDVILDIDVYAEGLQPINDWCRIVTNYNHAAFDTFINYIRPEVFESLK